MIAAETRFRSQRDGYRAARAARRRRVQRMRPLPKHCTIVVPYAKHIPSYAIARVSIILLEQDGAKVAVPRERWEDMHNREA